MPYNVTTDKTWARIEGDIEESFRKWGGIALGWRVATLLAPRSATKQNQTPQERTVTLRAGDVFVVPKGTEHKPSSPDGSILMFELSGTVTTGDRHEGEIPAHVDSTTGHDLGSPAEAQADGKADNSAPPRLVRETLPAARGRTR